MFVDMFASVKGIVLAEHGIRVSGSCIAYSEVVCCAVLCRSALSNLQSTIVFLACRHVQQLQSHWALQLIFSACSTASKLRLAPPPTAEWMAQQ
jgi:hypothetical protein